MTPQEGSVKEKVWLCLKCNLSLELGKVDISYMGSTFPVDLMKCSGCGQVYVPEDLALGKMMQVEKLLEDK